MMAIVSDLLDLVACLGVGAATLRILGILEDLQPLERLTISFAVGLGGLGWLLFLLGYAGLFQPLPLAVFLALSGIGVVFLWPLEMSLCRPAGAIIWLLVILLAHSLLADLFEGLSPPADADTLAYHFALPKDYVAAGGLTWVPRAADGTQPMLVQLSYVPMLALGGERALTLWTMLSGWAPVALLYTLLRRYVAGRWALIGALVFMSTPAVIYGAGSGQVDVRATAFSMLATVAVIDARRTGRLSYVVLAGLAAGFAAATKYHGLIFAAAVGAAVLLIEHRRWSNVLIFGATAVIAGAQWYVWNWINLGDPIYPLLATKFGLGPYGDIWSHGYFEWFKFGAMDRYVAIPPTLWWWLAYPVWATFGGSPIFESGRTGFGPFLALVAPFALLGAWRFRARLLSHPLAIAVFISIVFYTVWFFTGSAQRVRFLMPIYPLVLMATIVAAERYANVVWKQRLFAAGIAATLAVQAAGTDVFALNYARHVLTGESRDAFLMRNVSNYEPVRWINENLSSNDRVFTLERQTIYLYQVPVYYGHLYEDPAVDLRPTTPPEVTIRQLRAQGITHVLTDADNTGGGPFRPGPCFEELRSFKAAIIGSRTLQLSTPSSRSVLYRFHPDCVPVARVSD